MYKDLNRAINLTDQYNTLYKTSFTPTPKWRLFPEEDGICEFANQQWICNGMSRLYLLLFQANKELYVAQSLSFGRWCYQYFKDNNGTCVGCSPHWSDLPVSIVAIPAPEDKEFEKLSLEDFLIKNTTQLIIL